MGEVLDKTTFAVEEVANEICDQVELPTAEEVIYHEALDEKSLDTTLVASEEEVIEVPEVKVFENANFRLRCSCGADVLLAEGVNGGMQYVVPCTDSHTLDIQCPECLTKIQFYFVENTSIMEDAEILEEYSHEVNNEIDEQVSQADKQA